MHQTASLSICLNDALALENQWEAWVRGGPLPLLLALGSQPTLFPFAAGRVAGVLIEAIAQAGQAPLDLKQPFQDDAYIWALGV